MSLYWITSPHVVWQEVLSHDKPIPPSRWRCNFTAALQRTDMVKCTKWVLVLLMVLTVSVGPFIGGVDEGPSGEIDRKTHCSNVNQETDNILLNLVFQSWWCFKAEYSGEDVMWVSSAMSELNLETSGTTVVTAQCTAKSLYKESCNDQLIIIN